MPAGKPMLSAVIRIGEELAKLQCPRSQHGRFTLLVPGETLHKLRRETGTRHAAAIEVRTRWGRIEVVSC